MEYKYSSLVLGKYDVGEIDRIYILLTKESGKIKVLGKSTRRLNAKLAGNLEPLTEAEIFIAKTKGIGKITGAIPINNFTKIKSDIDSLEKTFHIFKILDKILPEQAKDEKIFDFLKSFLGIMENLKDKSKSELLSLGFLFKTLGELGYKLEMEKCIACGKRLEPNNNFFSVSRGGILCAKCQAGEIRKIRISSDSIKLIRIFMKNRIENLVKLKVLKKDIDNLKLIINENLNWIT